MGYISKNKQPLSIPQEGRNSGSKCFECSRLCNLSRNAKVNHILPLNFSLKLSLGFVVVLTDLQTLDARD